MRVIVTMLVAPVTGLGQCGGSRRADSWGQSSCPAPAWPGASGLPAAASAQHPSPDWMPGDGWLPGPLGAGTSWGPARLRGRERSGPLPRPQPPLPPQTRGPPCCADKPRLRRPPPSAQTPRGPRRPSPTLAAGAAPPPRGGSLGSLPRGCWRPAHLAPGCGPGGGTGRPAPAAAGEGRGPGARPRRRQLLGPASRVPMVTVSVVTAAGEGSGRRRPAPDVT